MKEVSIVGLTLAKRVFQATEPVPTAAWCSAEAIRGQVWSLHGAATCVVAMEAARPTYWAREIGKARMKFACCAAYVSLSQTAEECHLATQKPA